MIANGIASTNAMFAKWSCHVESDRKSGGIQRANPARKGISTDRIAIPVMMLQSYVLTERALITVIKLAPAKARKAS